MTSSTALILFDLDGTLVDPAGAITEGVSAALIAHGLPVPSDEVLRSMVGPSLMESLALVGVPADRIADVVASYRAGYLATGMARSRPYPGVAACAEALRAAGAVVAVATQKPEWLAEELLEVQGMRHLFASVHGSGRDETATKPGKESIIRAAIQCHGGSSERTVMIGDRRHDVEGAHANGIECIGVSWGFAGPGELAAAGASAVVSSGEELLGLLRDRI